LRRVGVVTVRELAEQRAEGELIAEAIKRPYGSDDPEIEVWHRAPWDDVLDSMATLAGVSVDDLLASAEAFAAPIEDGKYVLIDARTPAEYEAGHVPGAINIPMGEFVHRLNELPADKDTPIFLYCHTHRRSGYAAGVTMMLGYTNVKNAKNGWKAWAEGDTPLGPTEE